jgi:hypothetical protein
MRVASVLALLALGACSSSAEIAQAQSAWEKKISAAVPVGTPLADAKRWLESQGAKPYSGRAVSDKDDSLYALETIRAREWYCDSWVILVTLRSSSDGRVSRYDITNSGSCL